MSHAKKILAGAVLGVIGLSGAVEAATVTITPTVRRFWSTETAFTTDQNAGTTTNTSTPTIVNGAYASGGVYEIQIAVGTSLTSTDTTAGYTGLGAAFFDLNSGASALPTHLSQDANAGGGIYDLSVKYNSAATKFQYTDPVTGGTVSAGTGAVPSNSVFSTVADAGTPGDFKGLQAALATGVYSGTDPRLNLGQSTQNSTLTGLDGNPPQVFDVFVDFDGSNTKTVLQPFAAAVTEGFSLHNNTTGLNTFFPVGTAGETYTLNSITFGATPEPASISLLGIGALGLIRRRRQA